MTQDAYAQMKSDLLALGGQRVWSLMVTLFGDLVQTEGSTIDGPVLSAIMAQMDVRPEAVRVALHRLRNDDWIASVKQGRTGQHGLTAASRRETLAASARIYADPQGETGGWQLAVLEQSGMPDRNAMLTAGFVPLTARVFVGNAIATVPADALHLEGRDPPHWLRAEISALMLETEYSALLPLLERAHDTLTQETLTPLQTAVLRCLIVHNWRRIVLRHPALPRTLLPDDWAGHRCHLAVNALLTRFPRPEMDAILPS